MKRMIAPIAALAISMAGVGYLKPAPRAPQAVAAQPAAAKPAPRVHRPKPKRQAISKRARGGMAQPVRRQQAQPARTQPKRDVCAEARRQYSRIMALPISERIAAAREAMRGHSAAEIAAGRRCLGL